MIEKEFPGFIDVHVHFRDPGMSDAETRATGSAAAAAGGFASVVTMPNTTPAGDNEGWIREQIEDETLPILILPSACITKGRQGKEVANLESLAQAGASFFTDDGSYVLDDKVMAEAMKRAAKLDIAICEHAMDPRLVANGVIRDCEIARRFSLPTIPAEAECAAIRRDISICRDTGCRLHIQHISTAQGVELVREARKEGLPVTAEATPHHLLLCCEEIPTDDANFKMAPPLGTREDRAELRKAVKEGLLMFATDHAPHPAKTKSCGFAKSANGIIGLECAIPITYKVMVEGEGMSIEDWAALWWKMPREILSRSAAERHEKFSRNTKITIGQKKKVDLSSFKSFSRNCPYGEMEFDCWPIAQS